MPAMQRDWTGHVDRRLFIPDVIYVQREALGNLVPLNRRDEPELWEKLVAADDAIATRLESITLPDGSDLPFLPVSSSSAPSIMNIMLDELGLEPGMSVLEIGTGTGWNAAVMAEAGATVTTIEIDAEVADHARAALNRAGYSNVIVVTGDGELGVTERAPYDRLIATAATDVVPYAWVRQVRNGGLIVFPYTGKHRNHGLGVLTVNGGAASGPIVTRGQAGFMPLRGRRQSQAELQAIKEAAHVEVIVTENGQQVSVSD